jgi:hypothetical protein
MFFKIKLLVKTMEGCRSYFSILFCTLFLMTQSSMAFQYFQPQVFHNSGREWLGFDDRACCSSRKAVFRQFSGFPFTARSKKALARDMNSQSNFKLSPPFAQIDGVKRNIHRLASQAALEFCVSFARLSLEIFDLVLRVGGLLFRILSALVQLVLKFSRAFSFYSRFRFPHDL